jgi:1-acyl-sn-glycerol-3-phosphate acyltransferase
MSLMSIVSPPVERPSDRPLTPPGPWIAAARDCRNVHLRLPGRIIYRFFWLLGRFTWFCTLKVEIIRPEAMTRAGGYLLASTHLSHLEPFILGLL